nr:hypothetical protein [Salinivirgaceae bacterium]
IDNDLSKIEKRKPVEKPDFNIQLLDPFPKDYEKYYDDNFGMRKPYLKAFTYLNFKYFKRTAPGSKVVIGKDSWMFKVRSMLPSTADTVRYTDKQLRLFRNELRKRRRYYDSVGVDWYLIIVPSKPSAYHDKVPAQYAVRGRSYKSKVDQFVQMANEHGLSDNILYLKDTIIAKRGAHPLFFKIDHHWNRLGAFYGASTILNFIQKNNPNVQNRLNFDNYTLSWDSRNSGNLSSAYGGFKFITDSLPVLEPGSRVPEVKKGKNRGYKPPKHFAYKWLYEIVKKTDNSEAPKVLIIRDSFTNSLIPFLSTAFSETLYIWDGWRYKMNAEIVEKEKPDIMLTIVVETHITELIR